MSEIDVEDTAVRLGRDLTTTYGTTGAAAAENLRKWLSGRVPLVDVESLASVVDQAPLDLIHECFWRDLPFGTGGVRGTVGMGPNRINQTVVGLTIQAHCDFIDGNIERLAKAGHTRTVVIANDVRVYRDINHAFKGSPPSDLVQTSSRSLALLAAEIYAANGFKVFILSPESNDAYLTTPELSFLIRFLRAAGGVNMSASHNPPDDNGVKVYDELGGQYLPPYDEDLTKRAGQVTHVNWKPFAEGVAAGEIVDVPADALAAYHALYRELFARHKVAGDRRTPVVFTPLAGCGERTAGVVLRESGFDIHIPENQRADAPDADPDYRGSFRSIPLLAPNPEVPESTVPACAFADRVGARLVLASDPDADRLGAEVRHGDGWVHLTGNQIATILAYYLLLDPNGPQLRGGVYSTLVTTKAVPTIAERAGCAHVVSDLLVGFKYIGDAVRSYSAGTDMSSSDALSFATEESHGVLITADLRDKDAVSGLVHLASLHEHLYAENRTLRDYLDDIYKEIGYIGDRGRSLVIEGSAGIAMIRKVMEKLRENSPASIAGLEVLAVDDRWDERPESEGGYGKIKSDTDREARNILTFDLADGYTLNIRPSGTEPKLKYYVHTPARPDPATQEKVDELSDHVYREFAQLAGRTLSPAIAGLPDVVPLDAKVAIEKEVLPRLFERLDSDADDLDLVRDQLSQQLGDWVKGSDPVAVIRASLLAAIDDWPSPQRDLAGTVLSPTGTA